MSQVEQSKNDTPASKSIFVSKLPFLLQGWNKEYILEEDGSYLSKEYVLYPRLLFFISGIPIKATRIRKDKDYGWIFEIEEFLGWRRIAQKVSQDSESPFGGWALFNGRFFTVSEKSNTWIK